MKKIFKFAFAALVGMTATAITTSCTEEYEYDPVSPATGAQVFFANDVATSYNIDIEGSSFEIPLNRANTKDAVTVSLAHTDSTGFYSIPATVTFEAGADKVNIPISYDNTMMAYDQVFIDTLLITSEDALTPYGSQRLAFSAVAPSPYVTVGKGTFTDNFWFEATATVTIMQNTQNPNEFRLMNAFDAIAEATWPNDGGADNLDGNQDPYIQITLLHPGDTWYGVEITQEGLVGFTDLNTGYYHSSYSADVYMLHPGRFSNYADESIFAYNRVVEWQENGLPGRIHLSPYYYMFGVGGWNNTTNDGQVVIDFPGYEPKDFSLDLGILGVLTSMEGNPYATITAEIGADVDEAVATVVSADDDAEAVAAALASGETEGTSINNGTNYVPIAEDLTGKLQVVVALISEGELADYNTVEFEYYGGGANPWEVQGTGDYVYTIVFTDDEGNPYTDAGLELQYNKEENAYRLTHWGYDVDFTFTWDKSTNAVFVPSQYTGWTHSSYGDVYVVESDTYSAAIEGWDEEPNDGPSYFDPETNTFHFNVAYYVSAGYFGHGEETFTISAAQARALGVNSKAVKPEVNSNLKLQLKQKAQKAFSEKKIASRLLIG